MIQSVYFRPRTRPCYCDVSKGKLFKRETESRKQFTRLKHDRTKTLINLFNGETTILQRYECWGKI